MDEQKFEDEERWQPTEAGQVSTDPPPDRDDYGDDEGFEYEMGAWRNRKRKRASGEPVFQDFEDPDEYHAALTRFHIREGLREGLQKGKEPSETELKAQQVELMEPDEIDREETRHDLTAQAEDFQRRSEQARELGNTREAFEHKQRALYIQREIDEIPKQTKIEKNCLEAGSLTIQERLHSAKHLNDADFERTRPDVDRDLWVVNQSAVNPENERDCSIWVVPQTSPYFPFVLNDKGCRPVRIKLPEGMTGRSVTDAAKACQGMHLFDYLSKTGKIDVDDVRPFLADSAPESRDPKTGQFVGQLEGDS
jgi:hypothetical protein